MTINLHPSTYEKYNPNSTLMPQSDTHTIGGIRKAQAWTFKDKDVCREFGDIIVKLQNGNKEERKEAYIRFFQFRRFFMLSEFKEYVKLLNTYRIKSNFITIEELLEKVYIEIVYPQSNLSEKGAMMAKGKNKNKASSENGPVTASTCNIPVGIDPRAEKLLQALAEVVRAATEYITGNSNTTHNQAVDTVKKLEENDDASSSDNNLFPDPIESSGLKPGNNDLFGDKPLSLPPEEEKPNLSLSTPATAQVPGKDTASLIAECRQLLISLARKAMDIKAVDKFFESFSQITGVPLKQLSDIKDIETLNLCKQFLEKQIQ